MNKATGLEKVTDVTIYTGTFGKKGCTCNCIGCTQNGYITKKEKNQGNIEQIKIIIDKLPNLENAYIIEGIKLVKEAITEKAKIKQIVMCENFADNQEIDKETDDYLRKVYAGKSIYKTFCT